MSPVDEQFAALAVARAWLSAQEVERALALLARRRSAGFSGSFLDLAVAERWLSPRQARKIAALQQASGGGRSASELAPVVPSQRHTPGAKSLSARSLDADDDSSELLTLAPDAGGGVPGESHDAEAAGSDIGEMQLQCPRCSTVFAPTAQAQSAGSAKCPTCAYQVDLVSVVDSQQFEPALPALGITTADGRDPFLGCVFAGCRIKKKLGQGGMGAVYLAEHLNLERPRAVKVLPPSFARNATYIERFLLEARTAAKLEHPNIVQVYDVGHSDGFIYIVMQFVDGGSLARVLKMKGKLRPSFALRVAEQIADGLAEAHRHGIVHRDIKPDNVLMNVEGNVKVADFGLAKTAGLGPDVTKHGQILGSPAYMSPEQCHGGELDGRSDLYSLGITLYQMLTGQRPFQADTPLAVMLMHQTETPRDPRALVPELPPVLAALVLRLLEKDPDARHSDAEALKRELHQMRALLKRLRRPTVVVSRRARRDDALFGMIALQNGYLTRAQLAEALRLQTRERVESGRASPLGEICQIEGFISTIEVNKVLVLQEQWPDDPQSRPRMTLEELLEAGVPVPGLSTEEADGDEQTDITLPPDHQHKGRKALDALKRDATEALSGAYDPLGVLTRFSPFLREYARTPLAREARAFLAELTERLTLTYNRRGQEAAQKTHLQEAISHFNTLLEINPTYAMGYNNRGIVFLRRGDFEQALKNFTRAIDLEPDKAVFYTNRGNVFRKRQRLDEAFADYSKAIELDPRQDRAWVNRGGIHLTHKRYAEAIEDFQGAIAANADSAEAHIGVAKVLLKQGKGASAVPLLESFLLAHPTRAKVVAALGEAQLGAGDELAAKRAFKHALRLDARLPDPFYQLAVLAARAGNAERALKLLTKACRRGFKKYRRIRTEPAFEGLRELPGFRQLLAGMR